LLYIFGGTADNKKRNDVVSYDCQKSKYLILKADDEEKKPCERDFHA